MSADRRVLRATDLPADFANALESMTVDGDPPATLEDALVAFDRLWDVTGVQVSLQQLYQPEPTRHAVDTGNRVEHVPCVLDALIVGLLVDPTGTDIRSTSPTGEDTVHLHLRADGIEVDPSTAVFSIGMDDSQAEDLERSVSALEETDSAVMASCSYINAFPDEPTYDGWKADLSGAHVMRLDFAALLAFARWAAGEWVVDGDREARGRQTRAG